jgi:predicted dehydrogenase
VDRVRWGIIGVGNVTERKSGPGFRQAERSELVAVMRRNGDLAADYARRNQVPRWYDDADELINDPDVDAVYVATPPDSHREYAVRVARAGKPVYVEKPMARTAQECEEMISACEPGGRGLVRGLLPSRDAALRHGQGDFGRWPHRCAPVGQHP